MYFNFLPQTQCVRCSGQSVLSAKCCSGEASKGAEDRSYGKDSSQSSCPYDASSVSVLYMYMCVHVNIWWW